VLIAIGESVVAVGIGAEHLTIDASRSPRSATATC
jgi:hypothetical protein